MKSVDQMKQWTKGLDSAIATIKALRRALLPNGQILRKQSMRNDIGSKLNDAQRLLDDVNVDMKWISDKA